MPRRKTFEFIGPCALVVRDYYNQRSVAPWALRNTIDKSTQATVGICKCIKTRIACKAFIGIRNLERLVAA